jgi:hypothetical protein
MERPLTALGLSLGPAGSSGGGRKGLRPNLDDHFAADFPRVPSFSSSFTPILILNLLALTTLINGSD